MKPLAYLAICATILLSVGCSENLITDEPRQTDVEIEPGTEDTERDEEQDPASNEEQEPEQGEENDPETGDENDPEEEWPAILMTDYIYFNDVAESFDYPAMISGSWSIEMADNDWFAVSPDHGEAGDLTITFTALTDNLSLQMRTTTLTVICGEDRWDIEVKQREHQLYRDFDFDFLFELSRRGLMPNPHSQSITLEDIEQLKQITELSVFGAYSYPEGKHLGKLTSLKGIEFFTELTKLSCWGNHITELDLSHNPKLKKLSCYNNDLTRLDISNCPHLTYLNCNNNQLTQIDFSNNTELRDIRVYNNELQDIDISKCVPLRNFNCANNRLTELDMSRNKHLYYLTCFNNPGRDGLFRVLSWFDNETIPTLAEPTEVRDSMKAQFTTKSWTYDGAPVAIDYIKAD